MYYYTKVLLSRNHVYYHRQQIHWKKLSCYKNHIYIVNSCGSNVKNNCENYKWNMVTKNRTHIFRWSVHADQVYPPDTDIWWPRTVLHHNSFTFCHLVFSYWRGKSYIHSNVGDMASWKWSKLCKFKVFVLVLMISCFCCFVYTITHAQEEEEEQQQNNIVTTKRMRIKIHVN